MRTYAKGLGGQRPQETDHPEINTMIRYLLHHYDEDISLQAMAQYVNMDENYLSGLFKKKTGETFINYLQHIRVNEARFYLEQTDLTVAEIGERVGFANPSYFFKIFKRWTKLTPNEYRQQCKGRAGTEPPAP
ncbi:helix-turn-helix transcriptional regulator [Paenibacillus sonchi]|uniref:Helix-turn-helix transcriptional regulator n=2 Tax=Paenibacillus sonchi TaxID=373687 RepID=A0A974PFV9_9BACL|nr:AraC family transcriptional regulator [Paenibacillus sonchi]QQZ63046.1 helix-turn-helix transcriptional regulator [Paenibacillus sonchi]